MSEQQLKKTALHQAHVDAGARMVPFAGFEMPVQYSGVIDEHMAVRTAVGLFDVSHMGEIIVSGPDATDLLQRVTSNNVAKLSPGRIHYTGLLTEQGTFVDDLLIYCKGDNYYFVVANAANYDKDCAFISKYAHGDVTVDCASEKYAQIAVQGPKAEQLLDQLTDLDLADMAYYSFEEGSVLGVPALVSRTGYTGEDGFEIYCAPESARKIWDALLEKGADLGVKPCGLACRDTLRLEAKMALYGNDIDDTVTPLEADLGWILKLKKKVDFNGKEILRKQKEEGVTRKLIGFEVKDKGIARQGYPIYVNDEVVGEVTSGTMSPYLKKAIGLAYLPVQHADIGTEMEIEVRGRRLQAEVVETPFYKRDS